MIKKPVPKEISIKESPAVKQTTDSTNNQIIESEKSKIIEPTQTEAKKSETKENEEDDFDSIYIENSFDKEVISIHGFSSESLMKMEHIFKTSDTNQPRAYFDKIKETVTKNFFVWIWILNLMYLEMVIGIVMLSFNVKKEVILSSGIVVKIMSILVPLFGLVLWLGVGPIKRNKLLFISFIFSIHMIPAAILKCIDLFSWWKNQPFSISLLYMISPVHIFLLFLYQYIDLLKGRYTLTKFTKILRFFVVIWGVLLGVTLCLLNIFVKNNFQFNGIFSSLGISCVAAEFVILGFQHATNKKNSIFTTLVLLFFLFLSSALYEISQIFLHFNPSKMKSFTWNDYGLVIYSLFFIMILIEVRLAESKKIMREVYLKQ